MVNQNGGLVHGYFAHNNYLWNEVETMEIKINLEKKYALLLVFSVVAVGLVLAYGEGKPEFVGHMQKDLSGLDTNGDNIPDNAEKLGGKLPSQYVSTQCRIASTTYTNEEAHELHALCERNEVLTGGGCTPSRTTGIRVTRPDVSPLAGDTRLAWYCQFVNGGQAHAVCCKTG